MSDVRLTHLRASGIQGLTIDEDLPRFALYCGPNGSGKTARLRAVTLALLGVGKDGLAPWATDDAPVIELGTSTGMTIVRRSRIARFADGGFSCKNEAAIEPSQGERTADAVQARIEREIAPDLVALDLGAFFALSGPERRRALLQAIGSAGTESPTAILARLNRELDGNPAWPRIRAAARPTGDGLDYLAALEGAARAQASEYRGAKASAEALARTEVPAAEGSPPEIQRALDAASAEVTRLAEARAAGQRGAQDRARHQKADSEIRGRLLRALQGASLQTEAGILQSGTLAELSEALDGVEAAAKDGLEEQQELLDRGEAACEKATEALRAASALASRAEGRVAAIRALLDGGADGGAASYTCPVCGNGTLNAKKGEAAIAKAEHALKGLEGKRQRAEEALALAVEGRTKADDAARSLSGRVMLLATISEQVGRLREIDAALREGESAASAAFDESALLAANERVAELRAKLETACRVEGERKARQDSGEQAERAEASRKAAEQVQALVGPSGLQGEMLEGPVADLAQRMNTRWTAAGKTGELGWVLTDARGKPDATLAWTRGDGGWQVPLATLSSGEKAVALACLVAAIAQGSSARTTVALVEAGEIDMETLSGLLESLAECDGLANAFVATHLEPYPLEAAGALFGFEVRRLGDRGADGAD